MKFTKKIMLVVLAAITCLSVTLGLPAATVSAAEAPSLNVKAAIAIDADTGKILFEQNGSEVLGIASMTKMVSDYLVLEAVKNGKIAWDDTVDISAYYETLSQNYELSNVPLYAGTKYTVRDLFSASIIASANAAIMVLAEYVAGSQEAFVKMMNDKVKEFGITDATLINASGLTNSDIGEKMVAGTPADGENYMSARDMAIVARHLLKDYPEVLETTAKTTAMFGENTANPVEMTSWNWMLPGLANAYAGVDGLKTGTTKIAGACFTGTATKDGNRVITVVLNALDHPNNASARFTETGKLLDYVFANWTKQTFDPTTVTLPKTKLSVDKGQQKSVGLQLEKTDPLTVWVHADDQIATETKISSDNLNDAGALVAPVNQGVKVGTLTITTADKLGYLEKGDGTTESINIVTAASVEKQTFFKGILEAVGDFFSGLGTWFANLLK